jgi:hypothetical protein
VVKVGEPGDVGIVEIQDMLFTVSGNTEGAVLMEWNVHELTQGLAGLWGKLSNNVCTGYYVQPLN